MVDDEPVGRRLLGQMLRERGYEVVDVESAAAALLALSRAGAPRMAIVDWNLGAIDGPQLCRLMRARQPYVYVVLTTARGGRQPLIDAMNSGADGFLQKPIEGDEIEAWLAAGQRIVVMQDRLLDVQAELERRASHDALTGVVNRAGLTDSLRREISRAQRTEAPVAAVLLDVDRFKSINDSHGHNVGDEVLIEFARRCSAAVRDYDLFGRYGGEEFLLVLPGASLADARIAGQRLVDTVAARAFDTTAGPLTVTTSAGVASTAQGHRSMESLLAAADGALYHAKHTGRARVCAATDTERPRT